MAEAEDIDLVNRDPNSINAHLSTINFQDVLAEPDGTHSIDCVWRNSYKCFECWKKLCYVIMTTLCGLCIAMEWGCEFAYIAFWHIWCITPFMKVLNLNCSVYKRIYSLCVGCCLEPLCEAFGALFINFKKG